MEQVLWAWLLIVNIIAYIVMVTDKKRAQHHRTRERIPEKTLFIWAAIGGALGIWIAMMTKRHKTKHRSFVIGVPLLLILNIVVYGYIWMTWIR